MGDISSDAVVNRLDQYIRGVQVWKETVLEEEVVPRAPEIETTGIHILGTGGVLTYLAQCCNPLPGERSSGHYARTRRDGSPP